MTELATSRLRLLGAILAALASGITLARTIRDERSKAAAEAADSVLNSLLESGETLASFTETLRSHVKLMETHLSDMAPAEADPEKELMGDAINTLVWTYKKRGQLMTVEQLCEAARLGGATLNADQAGVAIRRARSMRGLPAFPVPQQTVTALGGGDEADAVFVDDPLPEKSRVVIDADGTAFADGPPFDKHRSVAGTEADPHAVFVEGNV